MTREELIKELDGIVPKNPKSDWSIYQRKIVDLAIKALEQETVSKESYDHEYFLRKEFELKIDKLQRQLEEQESKGHWIDTNEKGFVYHRIYKCSHCGATVCEYPENMHESKYKYCSSCGSRNEVEE